MPKVSSIKAEEWVATTQRHADTLEGRTEETYVVRELPSKPTERQSAKTPTAKQKTAVTAAGKPAVAGAEWALSTALCSVFKPLGSAAGNSTESAEFAKLRATTLLSSLHAGRQAWQGIEASLETECFAHIKELGQLACSSSEQHAQMKLVPTVVLSCNSLAAGDQAATYARLLQHLKGQDAYVALLQPSHFGHGTGGALSETLHQLSGSTAAAVDDIYALYQWYADETGAGMQQAMAQQPQPQQQQQPRTPATAGQSGRKLRERKKPALLPGQQLLSTTYAAKWRANQQRQLVLLVQGAEQVPPLALSDLLAALLQDYARFPATLVLGCCRPASLFLTCLPHGCRERMAPHLYDLPSQDARLEALCSNLLCGAPPPLTLLLERPLLAALQHYEHQAGSADSVMRALELAHAFHHATQPLACLAPAAWTSPQAQTTQPNDAGKRTTSDLVVIEETDSDADGTSGSASDSDSDGANEQGGRSQRGEEGLSDKRVRSHRGHNLEEAVSKLPACIVLEAACSMQASLCADHTSDGAAAAAELRLGGAPQGNTAAKGRGKGKQQSSIAARKGAAANARDAGSKGFVGTSSDEVVQSARQLVVQEVRRAAHAYVRWRLAIQMCHTAAVSTGAACMQRELQLPALCAAATSSTFYRKHPRSGLSALQHVLGSLCGPHGQHSIASTLCDDALLLQLTSQLSELMADSQKWCCLEDVTALQATLEQLCAAGGDDAAVQADVVPHGPSSQGGGDGITPQKIAAPSQHPGGADSMVMSPAGPSRALVLQAVLSPTSVVRRGLAAAQLASPQHTAAQQGQQHVGTGMDCSQPDSQLMLMMSSQESGAVPNSVAGPAARGGPQNRRSRQQLLLQSIKKSAAPQQQQQAQQQQVQQMAAPVTHQSRIAGWLHDAISQLLAVCPFDLPGAMVFTFTDAAALEDACLTPSPRTAVHDALLHPSRVLGVHVLDDACPLSCDVEVAYQRLAGRDSVGVNSWFNDFCQVMAMDPRDYLAHQVLQPQQNKAPAAAKGKRKAEKGVGLKKEEEEMVGDEKQQQQRVTTWAARFSQAAAELQHMGIIRPNKRCKKEHSVQVMFQPAELHVGF